MNESLQTAERPRQVDAVSVKTVERSPKQQVLVNDTSQISSNYSSNKNYSSNSSNNNKRLLILYSSSTSGRPGDEKTAQHRAALTILKGMRIDDQTPQYLEQLDGASTDPKDRERRDELFALSDGHCSSQSQIYPQFFLVDSNDQIKFLCEWETFELMNDVGILTGFMNLGNTSYTTTNRTASSNTMMTTTTTTATSTSTFTTSIQKQDDVNHGDRRRHHSRNNSCPLLVTTIRPLRSSTRLDDERTTTNQMMITDGRKQVTVIAGHNNYDDDAVDDEVEKQLSMLEVKRLELVKDVIVVKEENDVFALGELIDYYQDEEEKKELIQSETIKSSKLKLS